MTPKRGEETSVALLLPLLSRFLPPGEPTSLEGNAPYPLSRSSSSWRPYFGIRESTGHPPRSEETQRTIRPRHPSVGLDLRESPNLRHPRLRSLAGRWLFAWNTHGMQRAALGVHQVRASIASTAQQQKEPMVITERSIGLCRVKDQRGHDVGSARQTSQCAQLYLLSIKYTEKKHCPKPTKTSNI